MKSEDELYHAICHIDDMGRPAITMSPMPSLSFWPNFASCSAVWWVFAYCETFECTPWPPELIYARCGT